MLPALQSTRSAARNGMCISNLRQWLIITTNYAASNRGRFWEDHGHDPKGVWMPVLADYYGDVGEFRFCPEATTVTHNFGGTSKAWGPFDTGFTHGFRNTDFGSYGINHWINPLGSNFRHGWRWRPQYQFETIWRIDDPNATPVFADCMWYGGNPFDYDSGTLMGTVPFFEDWYEINFSWAQDMGRFCTRRHRKQTNVAFADGHVDQLRMSALWNLSWHREFVPRDDVDVPWDN